MKSLKVNGIELFDQPWVSVTDGSGMLTGTAVRTQNLVVPGIHGEQIPVLQTYGPGTLVLPLIVQGVDRSTGAQSGDGTVQLRDNLRYLTRAVYAPRVEVVLEHEDGHKVRCVGRMRSDPIEGERYVSTPPAAQITVVLNIPGAFWEDVDPVTAERTLEHNEIAELAEFADATAPMDEMIITFGPGANPYLYQEDTDSVLAYRNIIFPGRELTINTATWELGTGDGEAWTPDYSDLRYYPRARWFELDPTVGVRIRLENSAGEPMTIKITARRKYQLGV